MSQINETNATSKFHAPLVLSPQRVPDDPDDPCDREYWQVIRKAGTLTWPSGAKVFGGTRTASTSNIFSNPQAVWTRTS